MADSSTTLVIERLQVEGGFLDGFDLRFEAGLNVLIGARGTGKTSVIELIRYCTDAPALASRFGDRARAHALSVLGDGKATLTVRVNGERHVIERTHREEEVAIGATRPLVLSQNEVEVVGVDETGRLRLIDEFRDGSRELVSASKAMSAVQSLSREIAELDTELALLNELIAGEPEVTNQLRKAESDALVDQTLEAESAEILHRLKVSGDAMSRVSASLAVLERTRESLVLWATELDNAGRRAPRLETWPGAQPDPVESAALVVDRTRRALESNTADLRSALPSIDHAAQELRSELGVLDDEGRRLRAEAESRRAGAGAAARLTAELTERLAHLQQLKSVAQNREERRQAAVSARASELDSIDRLRSQRFDSRALVEQQLNESLGPRVRVSLQRNGIVGMYASAIADSLRGSGLHYAELAPALAARVAPAELASAVERNDVPWFAETAGVSDERAGKVLAQLRTAGVSRILTAPIDDGVTLELLDGTRYKETPDLSTGQRCTVVLPIVLLHQVRPVILDQPEDHLDTAFIVETLVRSLAARDAGSQMIVSTHNANIPVLGNADRVTVMDSDGSRGFARHSEPLWDMRTVAAIESIMEGGRQAFQRRATFYSGSSS